MLIALLYPWAVWSIRKVRWRRQKLICHILDKRVVSCIVMIFFWSNLQILIQLSFIKKFRFELIISTKRKWLVNKNWITRQALRQCVWVRTGTFLLFCVKAKRCHQTVSTSVFLTNWLWGFYDWCTDRENHFCRDSSMTCPWDMTRSSMRRSIKPDLSRTMQMMTNSIILHYALCR